LEFEESPESYMSSLKEVLSSNEEKIVALGEFGLDYDRVNFCDVATQKKYFELQLRELSGFGLPLFLHCRGDGAAKDLLKVLQENTSSSVVGGVVHSFDGTVEEMNAFVEFGLHIGVNGWSVVIFGLL
jgi:TatD DNase family protein